MISLGNGLNFCSNIFLQTDGKILIGGTSQVDGNYKASVVRVLNDIQTGTDPVSMNSMQFTIFPNPADDVLHIQFAGQPGTGKRVVITDVYGRAVIRQALSTEYDISHLTAGIYFFGVFDQNGKLTAVQKFVVN